MEQKPGTEISPEKKLLEIIEKTKEEQIAQPQIARAGSVKSLDKKKSSMFDLGNKIFSAGGKFRSSFISGSASVFEIEKINKLLIGVVGILSVYFVFYFMIQSNSLNKNIKFSVDDVNKMIGKNAGTSVTSLAGPGNEYLSAFLDKMKKRNVFKPVKDAKRPGGSEAVQTKGLELVRNLKLVGTSIGLGPKDTYAMVEDSASRITYFLRKDETIFGAKVADIETDGVVLNYDDSSIELR